MNRAGNLLGAEVLSRDEFMAFDDDNEVFVAHTVDGFGETAQVVCGERCDRDAFGHGTAAPFRDGKGHSAHQIIAPAAEIAVHRIP
jgi:hypothetical protein